jgi:D-alanyl-D-alanine carboxypeptidase
VRRLRDYLPRFVHEPLRFTPAGGGYSTVGDLWRLLQALKNGSIPGGLPPGIGAAGGAPGLNADIEGELPGGYDLIVLANLDPPAAEHVAAMVRAWVRMKD